MTKTTKNLKEVLEIKQAYINTNKDCTISIVVVKRTDRKYWNHCCIWFNGQLTHEAIIEMIANAIPVTKVTSHHGIERPVLFTTMTNAIKRYWDLHIAIDTGKIKFKTQ